MDNRYEIAEQNGMSREFADWFFDNKKAGCGNVWFMMMAAMWEGWQGRAAMLQGAENVESRCAIQTAPALDSSPKNAESRCGESPVIPDDWVACSELMPEDNQEVITYNIFGYRHVSFFDEHSGHFFDRLDGSPVDCVEHVLVSHWMPLPAAPQHK
ncbi:DUF551 domain-containing protein [Enterobacter quasihormaechei]|uniref:DUF551 domain-containing protein n=1 Tax=Enterobacter quasihormaechei TaxID=2529382 RepID=UPI002FD00871